MDAANNASLQRRGMLIGKLVLQLPLARLRPVRKNWFDWLRTDVFRYNVDPCLVEILVEQNTSVPRAIASWRVSALDER